MVTDFVGREAELSDLARLFGSARLVTVVGPGGVGKTSVALRAAAGAVDDYLDGVWIVELSGLRDPVLLPNTVASALGIPEQAAGSPLQAVLDHLSDRRTLLLLDTCEHLIDACADLAEAILRAAPGVTVLATSRQPLDVAGEHTYPIEPLPLPDAVAMFAARASAAAPGFSLEGSGLAHVNTLCRRLDCIPLAIELAAVQLRLLTPAELLQLLDRHFATLSTGDPGGALPRHQTLRRAIQWSYDLCSPLEQALWARLSLFAGYFDLAAVEEVCAESDPERAEVLQALYGLVDKSVVLRESPSSDRYRLLDTIREFGTERLPAFGPAQSTRWRDRHFHRYLRLASGFRDSFASDEQMARYHALRDEHPNIRAALEYTLGGAADDGPACGPVLAGADLVNALALYWMISGRLREGGYWLGKVLAAVCDPTVARAATLATRGLLRSFQGLVEESIADCQEAISIASASGEPGIAARGYLHMNLSLTFSGLHSEALSTGLEAQERLTACGDRVGLLMLACQMGHLYQLSGQLDAALSTCASGLELLGPGSRERWLQSYLYLVSSLALFQMPGREQDCAAYASQGIGMKSELGDIAGIAYALEILGWLAARSSRFARCAWLLGSADPLWRRVGSRFGGTALMEVVHQQARSGAVAALGDSSFESLWQSGAVLPVEDVVMLAVTGADDLPVT
jgi:non-specific serine/threonine protein kinase